MSELEFARLNTDGVSRAAKQVSGESGLDSPTSEVTVLSMHRPGLQGIIPVEPRISLAPTKLQACIRVSLAVLQH